jgi:hypothetical protein
MCNIINFMEKLGASAEFQELSEAEVANMLRAENLLEAEHINVIADVEALLDARKNVVCGIMPAEEPAEEPAEQPAEEPAEQPEKTE